MRRFNAPFRIASLLIPGVLASAAAASPIPELDALVRAHVQVVSPGREIHLYSWGKRAVIRRGKPDSMPLEVQTAQYLAHLYREFQNGIGDGHAGPGVYLATDPVSSRTFGGIGNHWVLMQFVLPAGSRMLGTQPLLSPRIVARLRQVGCAPSMPRLRDFFKAAGIPACRALRDQILHEQGIDVIRYTYSMYPPTRFPPAICPGVRTVEALVAVSSRFMDLNAGRGRRLSVFEATPPTSPGARENARIIAALFDLAPPLPGDEGPPWPLLAAGQERPVSTDLAAWARQNLMGCGKFPEDTPTP